MDVVSAEVSARRKGFLDRVFPLGHWLGAQASGGIEMGQAKTRLICTVVGVGGFAVMSPFAALPNGIIATAIVFPLYALAYLILVYKHPAPTHTRRGFAILMDNLVFGNRHVLGGGTTKAVGRPDIFGLHFYSERGLFVVLAVTAVVFANVFLAVRRSSFGRMLAAMRDAPNACQTLGMNITAAKLKVFGLYVRNFWSEIFRHRPADREHLDVRA